MSLFQNEKSRFIFKTVKAKINNELIPAIEINESFKYLGRHIDYSMSNQEHKDNLCDTVDELLKDIDSLPLHP